MSREQNTDSQGERTSQNKSPETPFGGFFCLSESPVLDGIAC